MFAGAAREAVFSNPEVIARIEKDFIPLALKAGTVQNPPPGIEGRLYREFRRTQPAPQGICVANSSGKALAWALMFEDDPSVLGFFDHALDRYADHPEGRVDTERFRRFPHHKMDNLPGDAVVASIPEAHAAADPCPGHLRTSPGGLRGKVVGRAYGDDGKPLSEVRTQDNYIEDIFEITKPMQEAFADARANAKAGGRFDVPIELARVLVSNAYLGHLDVNPLGGRAVGGKTDAEKIALWAEEAGDGILRIGGRSSVSGRDGGRGRRQDGRVWSHSVDLQWRGFLEIDDTGIRELTLSAQGREKLKWRGPGNAEGAGISPVAHLPGGRNLDIACAVRYGFTAVRGAP